MSSRPAERTKTAVGRRYAAISTVVVWVLAVLGAVMAVCAAAALYLSSWDFRPQDRSEGDWRAIAWGGTSGYVLASCAVAAAVVVLLLITPQAVGGRRSGELVGPGAVVLVAVVLVLLAIRVGLPVLDQANYLVDHTGLF